MSLLRSFSAVLPGCVLYCAYEHTYTTLAYISALHAGIQSTGEQWSMGLCSSSERFSVLCCMPTILCLHAHIYWSNSLQRKSAAEPSQYELCNVPNENMFAKICCYSYSSCNQQGLLVLGQSPAALSASAGKSAQSADFGRTDCEVSGAIRRVDRHLDNDQRAQT